MKPLVKFNLRKKKKKKKKLFEGNFKFLVLKCSKFFLIACNFSSTKGRQGYFLF